LHIIAENQRVRETLTESKMRKMEQLLQAARRDQEQLRHNSYGTLQELRQEWRDHHETLREVRRTGLDSYTPRLNRQQPLRPNHGGGCPHTMPMKH